MQINVMFPSNTLIYNKLPLSVSKVLADLDYFMNDQIFQNVDKP